MTRELRRGELPTYIRIGQLSYWTGLPEAWLRREAQAGRIPSIDTGARRLFNLADVERALHEIAKGKKGDPPEPEAKA